MTSRNAARRHTGRNRMVPRPKPEPAPVITRTLEPETSAHDAVEWWGNKIDKPRFVYFIQQGDDGPIKIGEAFDPRSRLRELQCGNPGDLVLRAVVLATERTEKYLHRKWALDRIRGEWFNSDKLVGIAQATQRRQVEAATDGISRIHDIALMSEWEITPNTSSGWRKA